MDLSETDTHARFNDLLKVDFHDVEVRFNEDWRLLSPPEIIPDLFEKFKMNILSVVQIGRDVIKSYTDNSIFTRYFERDFELIFGCDYNLTQYRDYYYSIYNRDISLYIYDRIGDVETSLKVVLYGLWENENES